MHIKLHSLSIFIFSIIALTSCKFSGLAEKDYTALVNPFIGTVGSGNTFMGPSLPYGMVKPGPYLSYMSKNAPGTIYGFSHMHVSGMAGGGNGVPGEIIFMPFTGNQAVTEGKYQSIFSHNNEKATPAYYSVLLDDYHVKVELAATMRAGLHKYTFPESDPSGVVLKLGTGTLTVKDGEITGHSRSGVFFAAKFLTPFDHFMITDNGEVVEGKNRVKGEKVNGIFLFKTKKDEVVLLKVGISTVSVEGARNNLEKEIPDWNFDRVRGEARMAWNEELGKIEVEGGTKTERIIFYTALYHSMMHPNIYMDEDRKYRSADGKIYTAKDFDNYTNFSLWDTFRALHPLYTIINRERTNQFIRTFLERYDHTGRMLIMEFNGVEGEQPPMIGYHSLSVIADAYVKGIRDYDVPKTYEAMKKLANDLDRKGKKLYLEYGYIPCDLKGQSVSRTLEYSYDDWCITPLANDFNDDEALLYFEQRGDFYRNLFDKKYNFMVGRKRNFEFVSGFDPMQTINHYTEANAYQYTTFVPQDIEGLIALMGGDKIFEAWLDTCFTKQADFSKINVRDVTGLIGQYAHGNEPSHHIAYLYNYVGAAWKTQKMVRRIMSDLYTDEQDGIEGNEDCGQMSAWYVMSAMGLYSVTPGMDYYVIGSPLFDKVKINLENGRKFEIIAKDNGPGNMYIQSAELNGQPYQRSYLKNDVIMNGGKLVFEMGSAPNKKWGKKKGDRPRSLKKKFRYAKPPDIHFPDILFLGTTTIEMSPSEPGQRIYYTLDGSEPTEQAIPYTRPISIRKALTFRTRTYVDGIYPGYPITVHFREIDMLEAVPVKGLTPGLKYYLVDQPVENARRAMEKPVTTTGILKTFNVSMVDDERPFGCRFEGYIRVPATGVYTFSLEANDGAILYLNEKEIIDNDGGHRSQKLDMKIGLKKGWHPIRVDYFQQGLAKNLVLTWQGPGVNYQEIPAGVIYHK